MKKIMHKISLPLIAIAFAFCACKKNDLNKDKVWDAATPNASFVRFINAYTALTPSLGAPPNGPTVDFYINNIKMNATALGYSAIFPNVTGGGAYSQAPSGEVNIKVVLNRVSGTPLPSDTIVNGKYPLKADSNYSIILIDTVPNPTPNSPILMVSGEAPTMPAYGKYKVRFFNLSPTDDLYEVYLKTSETILATNISYKNASDWLELPLLETADSVFLRKVGTNVVLAKSAKFQPGNQRSITLWSRGNPNVAGRPRALSFFVTQ